MQRDLNPSFSHLCPIADTSLGHLLSCSVGRRNIGRLIEYRHNLAKYLCSALERDNDFIVLNREVNINSVIFMYKPRGYSHRSFSSEEQIATLNQLNKEIQDKLFCSGDFYVHTFSIPDLGGVLGTGNAMLQPMRYMCGNPITRTTDIDRMVAAVRDIGQQLETKYFPSQNDNFEKKVRAHG